jgi:hypothetical protein
MPIDIHVIDEISKEIMFQVMMSMGKDMTITTVDTATTTIMEDMVCIHC